MRTVFYSLTTLLFAAAAADLNLQGKYTFHICEPVQDERLISLAVNEYDHVEIKKTTNALDICTEAYRVNWRIENHMSAVLCILDEDQAHKDNKDKWHPMIRIDNVHKTRLMPQDPHNLALENALTDGLPLTDQLTFVDDDMILLEREDKVCIGLQKLIIAEAGSEEVFGEDNN